MSSPLKDVQVLIFDVFGTTVDWRGSVVGELEELGMKVGVRHTTEEWTEFANEWREGYITNTRRIAAGGTGTNNVDVMHREILNTLLTSPKWSHIGELLDDDARTDLNLVWHRLNGWPDTTPSLHKLKSHLILSTLSNGNVRLLVDLAKHANLPFDLILSASLFGSYKPNPTTYTSTLTHLSLSQTPHRAAMVAAHISDLRGAAGVGMKTVYVLRSGEEWPEEGRKDEEGGEGGGEGGEGGGEEGKVKTKEEGGEVDVIVNDFEELVELVVNRNRE